MKELSPEEYVRQNADKVEWSLISLHIESYSEKFVNDFEGDLVWHIISGSTSLPDFILKNYEHRLNWETVYSLNYLTEEQIRSRLPQTSKEWYCLSIFQELSEKFINDHIDLVNIPEVIVRNDMSESFLRTNVHRFDENAWQSIGRKKISEEFIIDFKDKFYEIILNMNEKISIDFLESIDIVNWVAISSGRRLTIEEVKKHFNKLSIVDLKMNPFLPRKEINSILELIENNFSTNSNV